MGPRQKRALLLYAFVVPYVCGIAYAAINYRDPFPTWIPFSAGAYLLVAMVLFYFISRRMAASDPPQDPAEFRRSLSWVADYINRSILLWAGLFLWGIYLTYKGELPPARAIPGAILLLGFFAIFGWSRYNIWKRQSTLPK